MSWYEYNEELHIRNEREIAFEEGLAQGIKQEQERTREQQKRAEHAEQEVKRLQAELKLRRS